MTKKDFRQLLARMEQIFFYFFDFDGTIAHTFLYIPRSDRDLVADAYVHALVHIWDTYALELLDSVHGLQNRAPGELIRAILDMEERCSPGSGRRDLIESAKKSFTTNYLHGKSRREIMSAYVPAGKGFPWKWDEKDPEKTITEFLVRGKLDTLLDLIGPHYPTPCSGFLFFYQKLLAHAQKTGVTIIPGIISSGHEVFIRRTFSAWKTECPDLLLTDDDLRCALGTDYVKMVKPNPLLVEMLYLQWLHSQKVKLTAGQFQAFKEVAKTRTIFFGDDTNKDGGLAKNAEVRFGHFKANLDPENVIEMSGDDFVFYDWRLIIQMLGL